MAGKQESGGVGRDKVHVLIKSLDGHKQHPFDSRTTLNEIHRFAYDQLVKQKGQIPFEGTWLERGGQRLDDAMVLGTLPEDEEQRPGVDFTFSLVWDTRGGC